MQTIKIVFLSSFPSVFLKQTLDIYRATLTSLRLFGGGEVELRCYFKESYTSQCQYYRLSYKSATVGNIEAFTQMWQNLLNISTIQQKKTRENLLQLQEDYVNFSWCDLTAWVIIRSRRFLCFRMPRRQKSMCQARRPWWPFVSFPPSNPMLREFFI
jgi:hypothetical protein